ncbi:MAG: ABC transporter ATP-binding protein [candidate division WOR-3 bacterium]|nr:ABC transporter ATP-binding protein [candidate division WOR-3 bacterium]MDW7988110.1 ABC transporter ATP-binding protein [candidate division WOR-3 bacterium]
MLIQTKNLTKHYYLGETVVEAVRNVSLEIEKGEYIAITGPSGSGKSTLMHLLGCLDTPTQGKYFFNGIDVTTLNDIELSKLRNKSFGFVFQTFNLLPRLSVEKNVELPLIYAKVSEKIRKEKTLKMLNRVGLMHRKDHRPNELSGGEMQRVAIARALINNPEVILADEPTGNLDSKTSKEIMNLFDEISKDGNTIILVTHDPNVAQHAKRQIRMLDGEIISDTKMELL